MSTAVTTSVPGDEGKSKPVADALPQEKGWAVHKPGEGYATRLGIMAVSMAYAAFACHHWYYNWVYIRTFIENLLTPLHLGGLVHWTYSPGAARFIGVGGTIAIATVAFLMAYFFIYVKKASAEFLIKTDNELAKVTWPKITPWFKVDTQVWGATYVVLIVVALMTLYVFGVDMMLQFVANHLFYGGNG